MASFFVLPDQIDQENRQILLQGEDVNHIKNVLRAAEGERITICDGAGTEYAAEIQEISKDRIVLQYSQSSPSRTEPPYQAILYQGISKGERMDLTIQKSVELGVYQIVPVICERTIVRFHNEKDRQAKQSRWQKIAAEAAKQCNRGILPEVCMPMELDQALERSKGASLRFIPYEEEQVVSLKRFLRGKESPKQIAFFIGPEGGFAAEEISAAENAGFQPVSIGSRILRTETAGPAVLAVLGYVFET